MKHWKYILERVLWSIGAIALIVLFVFAWQAKAVKKCTAIQIELTGNNTGFLFMDEKEILRLINEQGVQVGTPIGKINLTKLEKYLDSTKWVAHTDIYLDNQQQLQVKIEQRVPVARVFTVSGNSFYIDNIAQRLPLRQLSVMRLPVFTGFPSDNQKLSIPDSLLLNDILHFSMTIQQDSFFLAQIAQVNIAPNGDFEMVPTLGDHMVLFGSVENLEDKLNRLYTFYKKVWVPSGINAFQVLDLRFDHQVVALKKGMQPIQYAPGAINFLKLGNIADSVFVVDSAKLAKPVPIKDTALKTDTVVKKKPLAIKPISKVVAPKKLLKQNTKTTSKKSNNKTNNKSLKDKKKTVKAVMPKSRIQTTTKQNN
jgi:cell division protein FtsQ